MIRIEKSATTDSRTCDPGAVTKEQLLNSTYQHIHDVRQGLKMFRGLLEEAITMHDDHKLETIDRFYEAFRTNMKDETWWKEHKQVTRHHLQDPADVPDDVNLVDVIEYITDCVMAGIARTGTVYAVSIDEDVLRRAFDNTVNLLRDEVVVRDDTTGENEQEKTWNGEIEMQLQRSMKLNSEEELLKFSPKQLFDLLMGKEEFTWDDLAQWLFEEHQPDMEDFIYILQEKWERQKVDESSLEDMGQ